MSRRQLFLSCTLAVALAAGVAAQSKPQTYKGLEIRVSGVERTTSLGLALFASSLSNLVNAPLDSGGTVTILNNGDEFLPALISAINGAR